MNWFPSDETFRLSAYRNAWIVDGNVARFFDGFFDKVSDRRFLSEIFGEYIGIKYWFYKCAISTIYFKSMLIFKLSRSILVARK